METRLVEQVKIYCLIMNPMTDRAESGRIAMVSFDKHNLINAYQNEFTEPYSDDRFRKVFRKNGPLEWLNPVLTFEGVDWFGHGIREEWIDRTNIDYVKTQYFFV